MGQRSLRCCHCIRKERIFQLAEDGDCERLESLIGKVPTLAQETDENSRQPLFYASENGHTQACRLLLDAGNDINSGPPADYSALHMAARNGHVATCQLLVERGAKVDAKGPLNYTPLMEASASGQAEVVDLFLGSIGRIAPEDVSKALELVGIRRDVPAYANSGTHVVFHHHGYGLPSKATAVLRSKVAWGSPQRQIRNLSHHDSSASTSESSLLDRMDHAQEAGGIQRLQIAELAGSEHCPITCTNN
jgi:hypothetical protein